MSAPRVRFSTREYEMDHGAKPRGRGRWAFCPQVRYNDPRSPYLDFVFRADEGTLTAAKRQAVAHFQALGIADVIVVCA